MATDELVLTEKHLAVRIYEYEKIIHGFNIQLGRASLCKSKYAASPDNGFIHGDPSVSRKHAILLFDPLPGNPTWSMEACEGKNGTLLDDKPFTNGPIKWGDQISLSDTVKFSFTPVLCIDRKDPVKYVSLLMVNNVSFALAAEAILIADMTGKPFEDVVPFRTGAEGKWLLDRFAPLHNTMQKLIRHKKYERLAITDRRLNSESIFETAWEHLNSVCKRHGLLLHADMFSGTHDQAFEIHGLPNDWLDDSPEIVSLVDDDDSKSEEDEEYSTDTSSSSSEKSSSDSELFRVHSLHDADDDTLDHDTIDQSKTMNDTTLSEAEFKPRNLAQEYEAITAGDVSAQEETAEARDPIAEMKHDHHENSSIEDSSIDEDFSLPYDEMSFASNDEEDDASYTSGESEITKAYGETDLWISKEELILLKTEGLTKEVETETLEAALVKPNLSKSLKRGHSEMESGSGLPTKTIPKKRRIGRNAFYLVTGALIGSVSSFIALVASSPDTALLHGSQ